MRPPLRAVVWSELQCLEIAGLGKRFVVSDQRDKFVLDTTSAAASRLSDRPEADGFIRLGFRCFEREPILLCVRRAGRLWIVTEGR